VGKAAADGLLLLSFFLRLIQLAITRDHDLLSSFINNPISKSILISFMFNASEWKRLKERESEIFEVAF
jgi:hypothetical protein